MPTVYEIDTLEWPDGTILKFRDDRYDSLPAAEVEYAHGTSGLVATNVQTAIDEVVADMKGTTEAYAQFHLGFYLDENGGLCQVNEI